MTVKAVPVRRTAHLLHHEAVGYGALILLAAAVPLIFGNQPYIMQVAVAACLAAALAQSLNLAMGFTGLVSFSQAAFYGIGAYTSALATLRLHWSVWPALLLAVLLTMLIGAVLGLPTLRIGGAYLAIATIGFQVIIQVIMFQWVSLTNGPTGLVKIPPPVLFGWTIHQGTDYYFLVLVWLIVMSLLLYRIRRSRMGYELLAVRADEQAALAMGIRARTLKIIAFALSAGLAAGTGSLYVHYIGSIDPYAFDLTLSSTVVVMVILGGGGSIGGVILGAGLLSVLPEYLRALENYRIVVYGLAMILLTLFFPKGLAGLWRLATEWMAGRGWRRAKIVPVRSDHAPGS